jgi:hypothetical protein
VGIGATAAEREAAAGTRESAPVVVAGNARRFAGRPAAVPATENAEAAVGPTGERLGVVIIVFVCRRLV